MVTLVRPIMVLMGIACLSSVFEQVLAKSGNKTWANIVDTVSYIVAYGIVLWIVKDAVLFVIKKFMYFA